jgi:hypothetical protein
MRAFSWTPAIAGAALAFILATGPVLAETVNFKADLKGSEEVPPTDSAGTGTVEATFDTETKAFAWTIT